jgi:hypothetical protein
MSHIGFIADESQKAADSLRQEYIQNYKEREKQLIYKNTLYTLKSVEIKIKKGPIGNFSIPRFTKA